MGQAGLGYILAIFSLIVVILMLGVIIFMLQYRKRKILYDSEMERVNEAHKLDLLNTQVDVQASTMTTIGKELHDNLGQKVTLASIYLQQIPLKKNQESISEEIGSVNNMLNDILSELRRLSKSLVDQNLSFLSLSDLVKKEADHIRKAANVAVEVSFECEKKDIAFPIKNNILRMFQEFAQNSIKHSHCKKITVRFDCEDNIGKLVCSDDGIGFDPKAEVKGIGLTNLNRRALEMGAQLTIDSEKGKGTLMTLIIENFN
jgi:signal transduction histidine kinase